MPKLWEENSMSKLFVGATIGIVLGIMAMCLCIVGDDCYYDPDE